MINRLCYNRICLHFSVPSCFKSSLNWLNWSLLNCIYFHTSWEWWPLQSHNGILFTLFYSCPLAMSLHYELLWRKNTLESLSYCCYHAFWDHFDHCILCHCFCSCCANGKSLLWQSTREARIGTSHCYYGWRSDGFLVYGMLTAGQLVCPIQYQVHGVACSWEESVLGEMDILHLRY